MLREWLYHLRESAQTEGERRRARLKFVRIFLDAFWWWGCYVDFPFCRDLLADWSDFIAEFGSRGPNEWDMIAEAWETATRLQTKADALLQEIGLVLYEDDRRESDKLLDDAHTALGATEYRHLALCRLKTSRRDAD